MRFKVLMVLGLVLLVIAAGCGGQPSGDSVDEGRVDIRGVVASVQPADGTGADNDILGWVLIEGEREKDTQFDKADVAITEKTRILERSGGVLTESTFGSLREGLSVEATFTGPVAESYPVQATAEEIVWEKAGEKSGIERHPSSSLLC